MTDKKKSFEHDSLQDCTSIVRYLNAITEGFENGELSLNGREGEIVLSPRGLIRFEIQASERPDRNRLTLRFTWKPQDESAEDQVGALHISGKNP